MTRWIPVLVIVAVLAGVGWWWYHPSVVTTVNPVHEQRATANEHEVEQKDSAIRGLSAKITEYRDLADRERAARVVAEQKAGTFADRARALALEVKRLEAATRQSPIASRLQALERLRALGYK